ncbi:hypothetical protein K461DRAFT_132402 [Myriangium duriaei CBS 260.36]|uniref:Uncharacterized protein n=1 Tax=Myriangium duriaei CBS 260.36 TaxID=1168546 RepID=A0A9P4J5W2_9PEZI|nr:hypothetical protein K461DRAFT_132402 [Myriangium duriaei CBS 260.36]
MGDRRPLSSFTLGDFDHPPATITLGEHSMTRLDRLGRLLERQREDSRTQADAARHERWSNLPGARRRRTFRTAGTHSPTYEGRGWSRSEDSPDDDDDRPRQAKRRKLDVTSSVYERSYKYGHYGQVEPGKLKLELGDCNGGVHSRAQRSPNFYGPENILKHDKSVYSSKESHCNIVLQHHDYTAFTLEKLIIIAPGDGFTAPVRAGTICVAMTWNDLMPLYLDTSSDTEQQSNSDEGEEDDDDEEEQLDLFESLHDPEILAAASSQDPNSWPPSFHPPTTYENIPQPLPAANSVSNRDARIWPTDSFWPPLEPTTRMRLSRLNAQQPEQTEEVVLESGFRVTMDYEHEVGWPEDPTSEVVLSDRARRQDVRRRDETVDSLDSGPWDTRFSSTWSRLRRGPRQSSGQTRSCGVQTGDASKQVSKDVTQVRFQIKEGKNKVAIKFDPPVSGTFLLLKLQSYAKARNVDIQTVIACGYAGPRLGKFWIF